MIKEYVEGRQWTWGESLSHLNNSLSPPSNCSQTTSTKQEPPAHNSLLFTTVLFSQAPTWPLLSTCECISLYNQRPIRLPFSISPKTASSSFLPSSKPFGRLVPAALFTEGSWKKGSKERICEARERKVSSGNLTHAALLICSSWEASQHAVIVWVLLPVVIKRK